jgi:PTH1 family peptidyl-tRNA hydrolase
LICLHDDLDLELGLVKVKESGSASGHNGLKSIISSCKSHHFDRIKIGIGRPNDVSKVAQYVLQPFDEKETVIFENHSMPKIMQILVNRLKLRERMTDLPK